VNLVQFWRKVYVYFLWKIVPLRNPIWIFCRLGESRYFTSTMLLASTFPPVFWKTGNCIFNFIQCQVSSQILNCGSKLTRTENSCPWPAFGAAKPMELELNAQECVSFISERLKQCDSQNSCFSSPVSRLPTRIINVGSKECPSTPKLEDGSRREANYIALSHCWVLPQTVVKRTKAILSTWRRGTPLDSSSKNVSRRR
jgi:hypothetical protein